MWRLQGDRGEARSLKLSEMWYLAAKELKQGVEDYYNPTKDTHCAIGAAIHYRLGHTTCLSSQKFFPNGIDADDLLIEIALFGDRFRGIVTLNDDDNWTFEQFAKKAEELGL